MGECATLGSAGVGVDIVEWPKTQNPLGIDGIGVDLKGFDLCHRKLTRASRKGGLGRRAGGCEAATPGRFVTSSCGLPPRLTTRLDGRELRRR